MRSVDQVFEAGNPVVSSPPEDYLVLVADVLSLLHAAERAGLCSGRAMRLRARLERGIELDPARLCAAEQWLRDWLASRELVPPFAINTPAVTAPVVTA